MNSDRIKAGACRPRPTLASISEKWIKGREGTGYTPRDREANEWRHVPRGKFQLKSALDSSALARLPKDISGVPSPQCARPKWPPGVCAPPLEGYSLAIAGRAVGRLRAVSIRRSPPQSCGLPIAPIGPTQVSLLKLLIG